MAMRELTGPIPGENYLSDTRNYPWHRPPDEADFVKIVDKAITSMNQPQKIAQILTALESGDTILDYVVGTARVSISSGRVPIDAAVLAVGPIARFVEAVADAAGIDYQRGWEQEPAVLTAARVKAMSGSTPPPAPPQPDPVEEPEPEAGGMMAPPSGPAPADEQAAMLGHYPEDTAQ